MRFVQEKRKGYEKKGSKGAMRGWSELIPDGMKRQR